MFGTTRALPRHYLGTIWGVPGNYPGTTPGLLKNRRSASSGRLEHIHGGPLLLGTPANTVDTTITTTTTARRPPLPPSLRLNSPTHCELLRVAELLNAMAAERNRLGCAAGMQASVR